MHANKNVLSASVERYKRLNKTMELIKLVIFLFSCKQNPCIVITTLKKFNSHTTDTREMRKCNFTQSALVYIIGSSSSTNSSSSISSAYHNTHTHAHKNRTTLQTIQATCRHWCGDGAFAWIAKYGNQQLAYKSIGRQLVSSCTHQCTYDYGLYVCVCMLSPFIVCYQHIQ